MSSRNQDLVPSGADCRLAPKGPKRFLSLQLRFEVQFFKSIFEHLFRLQVEGLGFLWNADPWLQDT